MTSFYEIHDWICFKHFSRQIRWRKGQKVNTQFISPFKHDKGGGGGVEVKLSKTELEKNARSKGSTESCFYHKFSWREGGGGGATVFFFLFVLVTDIIEPTKVSIFGPRYCKDAARTGPRLCRRCACMATLQQASNQAQPLLIWWRRDPNRVVAISGIHKGWAWFEATLQQARDQWSGLEWWRDHLRHHNLT